MIINENFHLVILHSHGKSPINGGFNWKIIYKWELMIINLPGHGICFIRDRPNRSHTQDARYQAVDPQWWHYGLKALHSHPKLPLVDVPRLQASLGEGWGNQRAICWRLRFNFSWKDKKWLVDLHFFKFQNSLVDLNSRVSGHLKENHALVGPLPAMDDPWVGIRVKRPAFAGASLVAGANGTHHPLPTLSNLDAKGFGWGEIYEIVFAVFATTQISKFPFNQS